MWNYIVETASAASVTAFWGIFWSWTAVSFFAVLYALGEAFIAGGAQDYSISYPAAGVRKGLIVAVIGLAGTVLGWMCLPLISGMAPFPPVSRFLAGATPGENAGIAVAVVSAIVFNIGVWMALSSEQWEKRAA